MTAAPVLPFEKWAWLDPTRFGILLEPASRGAYPEPDLHRLSAGLLVSVVGTCTCMFFLSEGYGAINLFWFGLANGLRLLLPEDPEEETEIVELEPEPAPAH